MAIASRSARIPDAKWEEHKFTIVQQFVDQNMSLGDIVKSLKTSNFIVTRNQLSHRLNKTWRIHKTTPKGEAEALWRCIEYRITERRKRGKSSNIILDGALVGPAKVMKETGRYSQLSWLSGIVTSSIRVSSDNMEVVSKWRSSTFFDINKRLISRGRCDQPLTGLHLRIPESEEHEAIRLLQVMRFGSAEEALQEQVKLLFLQASNKCLFPIYEGTKKTWPFLLNLIQLMEAVGLTHKPLDPGPDLTLLATREALFQQTFNSMTWLNGASGNYTGCFEGPLLHDEMDSVIRFIEWLLQSYQNPNIPLRCPCGNMTSALQFALACKLDTLTAILLRRRADPSGAPTYPDFELCCTMQLPPIVLAILSDRKSNSGILLREFKNPKKLLLELLLLKPLQYFHPREDTYRPDKQHRLYQMIDKWGDELDWLSVLEYVKNCVGPAWFENPEHSQGLLFGASRIPLEHGAVLNDNPALISVFHLACSKTDDVETLELLYSHGASVQGGLDITPDAARYMFDRQPFYIGEQELLDELRRNATPLKAALNNRRLDSHELRAFLLHVAQSGIETTDWIFDAAVVSADTKILHLALQASGWHTLQLHRRYGLLRVVMECCDFFFLSHTTTNGRLSYCNKADSHARAKIVRKLLEVAVNIAAGDAVRAVRLGDWNLAQRLQRLDPLGISAMPLPYEGGEISFLEATLLWCPEHSAEAIQTCRYDAGSLCAAVFGVCRGSLEPSTIEALFINRLLVCDASTLDNHMEMAAIGIALHNGRLDLLEILENDLPAECSARMHPDHYDNMEEVLAGPLWWHSQNVGSVGCFAVRLPLPIFATTIQRYKWDMNCLSLLVNFEDHHKIEVLKEYKDLLQTSEAFWDPEKVHPNSPLGYAISSGSFELAKTCLELGDSVNGLVSAPPSKRYTPLMVALYKGALDIVDLLLEWKADVNRTGLDFQSEDELIVAPLQIACRDGCLETAKRLIDRGADIDAIEHGWSALRYAAAYGRLDTIHLLLSKGAKVTGDDAWRLDEAIEVASEWGHLAAIRLLKDYAAKIGHAFVDDEDDQGEIGAEEIDEDGEYGWIETSMLDLV
ncbi:ankyrin repeat-containing domain protein [Apiospora hydei]|uniref:Ankyrin repeat-containing domain protein n=1 Tax=Apiospora hydei TaxID=1337664 RepID=A0ABR1WLD4_9PEZI